MSVRSSSPAGLLARAGLALALVVTGQAVMMPPAAAATLSVTSTADVATNFGACGNPAQLTSSGSLREAVCAANNAGASSSTITVAAGTYVLTNGELQMGEVSGSSITLNGAGAGSTIIDGNNASRVFDLDPNIVGGVTTSISGVTITNGMVTTFGGAGIIAGSGNAGTRDVLTISNSTISNNDVNSATTNKYGGGLQFFGGSLTITNSTFSGNTAGSSSGAAVAYAHEDIASGEQLTISGTTFSGNSTNASVANINVGGALHVSGVSTAPPMTVTSSRFVNNAVIGSGTGIAQGGAIFSEGGTLTVTGSTFTGNSVTGGAQRFGGAISVVGGVTAVHFNRITGNVSTVGSGVSLGASSGAALDATDNWWGCNTGPGTAGCDTAAGSPTVSPRLVLTATASPATVVGPTATSTITAALTTDSLGSAIGSANLGAFAGLQVGWSDPLPSGATVGAASSTISSGTASTTYNSQSTSGPGHVLATLDNGTATASVTVNRTPTITSANTVTFTVGTAGSFTVTTTGYPSPAISKTGTLPAGLSFTDNGNGTATLAGTPAAGSGGTYPLSLTANNGVAPNATQTLTVTVMQPAAITSASNATFTVGTAGSFTITTAGAPPVTAITETGALPAGVTFTDNGDGTATLAGTATAPGAFSMTIKASNGVAPDATQNFTLTVNQAPTVITNPSDQSVNPGASVSFTAAASGFPAPTVQWQRSTDGGASFTNIAGASSTSYTFTALAGDNGNHYRAVFTNTAGSATTTAATLTVSAAPTITSADHTTFTVGAAGSFTVTTSGVPNPTLSTTGTRPAWMTFTDNGDGTATITGTPPAGSGGSYGFTITADNGNDPPASQAFTLTVNELANFTSADQATFAVGSPGSFTVTTMPGYPTATAITETGSLPSGVTFTDNGDGTATLAGTPAAGTAGSYPLTLAATNTTGTRQQSFTLTVQPATTAPVITSADHATFSYASASSFTITTTAGYPTATTITKTGTLPAGVTFTDNGDGTATIAGTPTAAGAFPLTLTASNGATTDATQSFTLTVTQPPAITSADHTTFTAGAAGTFTVTTAPGYPTATTLTETGALPAGVSFTDNGDGTGTLSGTPAVGANGTYPLTISATNTAGTNQQAFTLTVGAAAQTITFASLPDKTFGDAPFTVSASATSGLPVTFTSTTLAVCTVTGATVTIKAAGSCAITAAQPGDASWQPAPSVTRAFVVGYRITNLAPPNKTIFKAGSTIPVKFQLTGANGNPIPDSVAAGLGCTVKVAFNTRTPVCASYNATSDQFQANLPTPANLMHGSSNTITITVTVGTTVVATSTVTVTAK
jgi:hypothetical protein